jgi:hypothetical protein
MATPHQKHAAQQTTGEQQLQTQHPVSEKDELKQAEANTTPPSKEDTEYVLADLKSKKSHANREEPK